MDERELERLQVALDGGATALTVPTSADEGEEPSAALERRLRDLTRAAVVHVPGVDYAGLTLQVSRRRLSSHGASHPEIAELDRLQVTLGEGPCVDAIDPGAAMLVTVRDFAQENERWPRFAPAAVERGILSLISFAMAPRDATPGALNLYAREAHAFGSGSVVIAGAFATQAAIAVYGARRITGLEHAVATRDTIGQAKGILMERHGISADDAFDRLVSASQHANLKLVEVARWLAGGAPVHAVPRR